MPIATTLSGIPIEFCLFAAMLAGVALLSRHSLAVALTGLVVILAFETFVTRYPTGTGLAALAEHGRHEWVTIANLGLLLVGFELLADQFEQSNMADHLPRHLPDGWTGGLVLLAMVFLFSAFLDNIAAAMIGGVIARHVYQRRVSIGFLAGIVAASNAGGAGSVIGDTTTTIMWLRGVSPSAVLHAYWGSIVAFAIFGPLASLAQHRHQPMLDHNEPDCPLNWTRIAIAGGILVTAVAANVAANRAGNENLPWLGLALWGAILITSLIAPPNWKRMASAAVGALFLVALVAAASLMPVYSLPAPSPHNTFGIGVVSAVFDNIPLTALALAQGGYDWGVLAYAVGFGGSMLWFGSSAGVALTNEYPEGRSVGAWLRQGWYIPLAYAIGFAALILIAGWRPEAISA